jgi:hypothetical protein
MKASTLLASLAIAALLSAPGTVHAQGQQAGGTQGGGQQGSGQQQVQKQQQRQAERAMSQDRVMDQERLQTRERTQDRSQVQTQTHAAKGAGEGVYGGNLMTLQERNQYRAELGSLKSDAERQQYEARHREKMQLRAKERGIDPQTTYE